jgi:hypothetical protein
MVERGCDEETGTGQAGKGEQLACQITPMEAAQRVTGCCSYTHTRKLRFDGKRHYI